LFKVKTRKFDFTNHLTNLVLISSAFRNVGNCLTILRYSF